MDRPEQAPPRRSQSQHRKSARENHRGGNTEVGYPGQAPVDHTQRTSNPITHAPMTDNYTSFNNNTRAEPVRGRGSLAQLEHEILQKASGEQYSNSRFERTTSPSSLPPATGVAIGLPITETGNYDQPLPLAAGVGIGIVMQDPIDSPGSNQLNNVPSTTSAPSHYNHDNSTRNTSRRQLERGINEQERFPREQFYTNDASLHQIDQRRSNARNYTEHDHSHANNASNQGIPSNTLLNRGAGNNVYTSVGIGMPIDSDNFTRETETTQRYHTDTNNEQMLHTAVPNNTVHQSNGNSTDAIVAESNASNAVPPPEEAMVYNADVQPVQDDGIQAVLADDDVVDAIGVAVIASEEEEQEVEQRRYKCFICTGAILLVLLIIVVVVPVVLLTGGDDDEVVFVAGPPTVAPTRAPSAMPSASPTTNEFQSLLECLRDDGVSQTEALSNRSSPQFRAASWIFNNDDFSANLECTDKKFKQRYALATLYFSVDGDSWQVCNRRNNVCTGGSDQNSWLSNADECTWYKLKCGDGQFITSINFSDLVPAERERSLMRGSFPFEMRELDQIEQLLLPGMRLNGTITDQFSTWSNVQTLALNANLFSGNVPGSFDVNNPALTSVNFTSNRFVGPIPESLGGTNLRSVSIGDNQLTGPIPNTLANLDSVALIDLQGNLLEGAVPGNLFTIGSLQNLFLNDNPALQGSLTSSIGELTSLRRLRLGNTQFGGELPPEIFTLPQLMELNLVNAQFTGTLSEQFALLSETLEDILLSNNGFSGPVPDAFGELQYLEILNITGNDLTGSVPAALCGRRGTGLWELQQLFVDCNVECDCCNPIDGCDRPSVTP